MAQNQYEYLIIGAGQSDLTPNPSPTGEGNVLLENKKPPHFAETYQAMTFRFSISLKCPSRETNIKLC